MKELLMNLGSSTELNELPFSYTAGVFIEESNLKTQMIMVI